MLAALLAEDADVLIEGERIAHIASGIQVPDGADVIDAGGSYLLPGMIDDQVHFREPGLTHKADLAHESRAAVAGGVTSFMDMPNTRPPTTTRMELENKLAIGAQHAAANYGFFFGATNDNIEQIRALKPDQACGIKVFMDIITNHTKVTRKSKQLCLFIIPHPLNTRYH